MSIIIDPDSLSYSVHHDFSNDQIHELSALCHDFLDIDKLWQIVKGFSTETNNCYFDMLCDNKCLDLQMKNEMMLLIYNSINTYTSDCITGAPEFLEQAHIAEPKHLNYESKETFQKVLNRFHLCKKTKYPESGETELKYQFNFSILEKSDLILEKTRLSEYVYSHMFITPNIEQMTEFDCSSKLVHLNPKEDFNYYYLFNNDSRYFLSVLLRAINSGTAPYTVTSQNGISLKALNNFISKFYNAFNSEVVQSNRLEKYLFLINTEYIFQVSFIRKIYKCLYPYFDKKNCDNFASFLYNLFLYLEVLNECPLNCVKIYMLENNINTLFKLQKLDDPNSNILFKNTKQLCSTLNSIFNIITNCFNLKKPSKEDITPKIKSLQTYFLYPQHAQAFKWSYLMQKQPYKLNSFYNEYLDFLFTYVFYSPSGISSSIYLIDNLVSGKDIYFNYLIQRK